MRLTLAALAFAVLALLADAGAMRACQDAGVAFETCHQQLFN